MRVFVTGGTGLVGGHLIPRLLERGDEVLVLTRRPDDAKQKWSHPCRVVAGDPTKPGAWQDDVAASDAVIHLAGEGIFNRRWSAEFKEVMRSSRVDSTLNVVAALAKAPRRADGTPKTLVSASAIGYYGPHGDERVDESTAPGDDFLARVCIEWEREANAASELGLRVVRVRTGVVLDRNGGALKTMLLPFKAGIGGPVAGGDHYMPWIHIHDVVRIYLAALDGDAWDGAVNASAPEPATNKEFSRALGRALHRPAIAPVPSLALKLLYGDMAQIVVTGQRAVPARTLELGYDFTHPDLDEALNAALED